MSWHLVEQLKVRFPEIEPFPRQVEEHHGEPGGGAAGQAPAPGRPAGKHEAKGPMYHTPGAVVPAGRVAEICLVLRDEAPYQMDYCSFVSAVDRPSAGHLEVLYHLFSTDTFHEILLKARVPRDDPHLPSVTSVWSGANWHERETFDLFGITFDGHPDLRRIMMTEDWTGHPLRKDYVYQEPRWLIELTAQRQREIQGLGVGDRA